MLGIVIFGHGLGHGVEGLLDGFAVVVGERAEQGFADVGANGVVIEVVAGVVPLCANGGAEETVVGLFQGCQRVLDVAFEAGVRGLEYNEVFEAGVNLKVFVLRAFNVGGL